MANILSNRTMVIITAFVIMSVLMPFLSLPSMKQGQEEQGLLFQKTKLVDAFALSEALIRCTDGKLVNSQDQCPGTDLCPPPQNNTVSNCIPRGPTNGTSTNTTTTSPGEENTMNNETTNKPNHCSKDRFTLHTPQCTD
jgi:hypothetical protein